MVFPPQRFIQGLNPPGICYPGLINIGVIVNVTKRYPAKLGDIWYYSQFCLVSQPAALCRQRALMAFFRPAVIFQQLNCMG